MCRALRGFLLITIICEFVIFFAFWLVKSAFAWCVVKFFEISFFCENATQPLHNRHPPHFCKNTQRSFGGLRGVVFAGAVFVLCWMLAMLYNRAFRWGCRVANVDFKAFFAFPFLAHKCRAVRCNRVLRGLPLLPLKGFTAWARWTFLAKSETS